jgi:hypothetical protein
MRFFQAICKTNRASNAYVMKRKNLANGFLSAKSLAGLMVFLCFSTLIYSQNNKNLYPSRKGLVAQTPPPATLNSECSDVPSAWGGAYLYIQRVQVGTINNATGNNGYTDYTGSQSTNMTIGTAYTLNITFANNGGVYGNVGVWVDWNHNNSFANAGEQIEWIYIATAGTNSVSITPPAGATLGNAVMRVAYWYDDGTYNYTTSSGCGSNSGNYDYGETEDYTINVQPACTAPTTPTSASASPAAICSGSSTLSFTGGSLGTSATWKWYSGSCGGTAVGSGTTVSVSPVATTTYYVRAEGTCGNSGCASVTLTYNSTSVAPTGITATPASICNGSSSTLSVSGGSLGSGGTWQWYTGSCGGTSAGSGASISVSPGTTTTYYVRAESTCGNTSCASVSLTVSPTSLSAAAAGPDQFICTSSTTLAATPPGAGTGTWTVLNGTGTITSVNSATSTVTGIPASSSVTLRWTISSSCATSVYDDVVIYTQ